MIKSLDDGLIIVAMILAVGLAVTAIFGESSLQSRVPGPACTLQMLMKKWFTKSTITSQL